MDGHFENSGKSREPLWSRPLWVLLVLSAIVLIAFFWIWRAETEETAQEVGALVDLQRSRLDLGLAAPVEAIQDAKFLSAASLSSDHFKQVLSSIADGDERIRSLRVLDKAGSELLMVRDRSLSSGDDAFDPETSGTAREFELEFIDAMRSLSEGEMMISEFSTSWSGPGAEPIFLVGTGLFFPSGARAGYIIGEVSAEKILSEVVSLYGDDESEFFVVSDDGRWIYDSRRSDPWDSLRRPGASRWLVDENPEAWRAMISSESGSLSLDGIWVFREHKPLQSMGSTSPRFLSATAGGGTGPVRSESFYVIKKVGSGPSWVEIWTAMVPIFILFILTILVLLPAVFRARRALRTSETATRNLRDATLRTRMAMEAAGVSEFRIDLDAGTVDIDKRMTGMLLLGPGQGIRTVEDWEERIHPQDRRKVIAHLEPFWREGSGSFSLRHRMKRGDETWGWYRFRGAVRMDETDRKKFILGAYIDLTDVVMREAELNRLEMATRQTLSGIAILDNEGVLEWANPAFRDRVHRRNIEISGKVIWELLVPDGEGAEDEREMIRSSILRGSEFSLISSHFAQGEETSWTRVVGNPVLDEGGIPSHYVVVESDISREKRAETDLRKSESLLTESQRLAGIGSWEIDLEEDSFYWSDEIYRIFGLSRDGVPDLNGLLESCHEEDRAKIKADIENAEETGEGFQREFRFRRPDGTEKWAFLKGMALREGNTTTKIYGVTQDISARKDSESALVKAKEEEEVLNLQLTDALDKAQISERKAKEASEAKSAFLSMISHEIRNPLNGVIGMADLLRQTDLDEIQDGYVETIHSSGSSVVMLLEDILDFNRLEHGKIHFEQKKFSLEAAIEDSVLQFSPRIAQKGLDLGFWIHPEVPRQITGDITRLKQILFNLLGNAVKFTEKGSISLEVELRERRPNDRCLLVFKIADTGMGIPRNRHDRIFKSFSQVDPSITRKFGGSGLGLAISRELALRMGGDIEFESEVGKGTCFEVLLAFPATFRSEPETRKNMDGRVLGFFRLPTREKQVRTTVESVGLKVHTASEVDDVVASIRGSNPKDLIFIDFELVKSKSVAAALKGRPEDARPPVVIGWPSEKTEFSFPSNWLALPVVRKRILGALDGDFGQRKKRPQDSASTPEVHHDMKILVAEDNAVNQKVIRLLLKRLGYDCTVVENGLLAVEKVLSEDFDLVLMDIQMPEMDGIEASTRIMREVPEERRPRIVALTAGATRDNREDAENAGMSGYLTKPVQAQALESELQAAMDGRRERI